MTSTMRLATRHLRVAFAATLALAASTAVSAATTAPSSLSPGAVAAQQPVEQLEELKDVWVRGKYTANMIVDAEDEFFKLYNKLNKNEDYDISCGYMSLERGSMMFYRRCVPEFIVMNSSYGSHYTSSFGTGPACMGGGGSVAYKDYNGDLFYQAACSYSGYGGYSSYVGFSGAPAVPARLLIMERGKAYAANVDAVIDSDPRLMAMATKLVAMYDQMELAQKQYIKVRSVKKVKTTKAMVR